MNYPEAVCLLGFRHNHKALCVSRRNNIKLWGFPGGKVDPGESRLQALLREIKEEIGVDLDPAKLFPIYRSICEGEVTYDVTTFFYIEELPELGELQAEEGLTVAYKDPEEICDPENSPFASYNKEVFTTFYGIVISHIGSGISVEDGFKSVQVD